MEDLSAIFELLNKGGITAIVAVLLIKYGPKILEAHKDWLVSAASVNVQNADANTSNAETNKANHELARQNGNTLAAVQKNLDKLTESAICKFSEVDCANFQKKA